MTFHVGQKVVCVRAADLRSECNVYGYPVEGNTYTISAIGIRFEELMVDVAEITGYASPLGWRADRFRPLVSRSTEAGVAALRTLLVTTPQREDA